VSNWEKVRIGKSDIFIADGNYSAKYPRSEEFISEGIPFIRANNLFNHTVSSQDMYYISERKHSELKKGHLLEGDVLITTRGNIGQVATVPVNYINANINAQIVLLRPNPKTLNYRFLMWDLLCNDVQGQIEKLQTGTALKQLPVGKLKEIEILLPPLETQKQIAKTLDAAAELLAMRKQQLAELNNLIKSTFYDMFGDPVANEKGWFIENLMDITTKIGSGATPKGGKESYQDEGISLIRSMNVHNGMFKYDQLAHIDDEQAKQLNNVTVKENDILINITGASVARSCIVPNDVLPARVNQHVSIVRLKEEKASSEYINNMFTSNSFQTQLLSIGGAGGATREAITKQQLQELVFPLPPLPLQSQFSTIVTKIEEQKTLVKKAIDETQHLFDSLMSEYFE
jgi:type I restriction enzyme S subunit